MRVFLVSTSKKCHHGVQLMMKLTKKHTTARTSTSNCAIADSGHHKVSASSI